MPIPGKLCIGILEEDNPLKSYFRFKPVLIEEGNIFVPYNGQEDYAEDGCIRIVPDKNESSHFKVRMREIGRYCVVDLRDHPGENDKIRPNKNYHGDNTERNTHIIYSDVIREPAADTIFEILPVETGEDAAQMALAIEEPCTPKVLIRTGGALGPNPWHFAPIQNIEGSLSFTREETPLELGEMQEFHLQGFHEEMQLSFVIAKPKPTPVAAPAPAPVAEAPVAEAPVFVRPAPIESPAEELERKQPIHSMSALDRAIAAQTGLNPRRGRSLLEIIEEKWRHSRLEQLGTPVPTEAMGMPTASPVEVAVTALRHAWSITGARESLLNAIRDMDEFRNEVASRYVLLQQDMLNEQLNELEAQRIRLNDEIRRLERGGDDLRAQLKKQIRQEDSAELAENTAKLTALRSELETLAAKAESAKQAAEEAEARFDKATDEELEKRILDAALNERLLSTMRSLQKKRAAGLPKVENTDMPDAKALLERFQQHLSARGLCSDTAFAANLLCCVALSPITVLTGPTGSGKTATAHTLADALGLTECGRFARFHADKLPLDKEESFRILANSTDTSVPMIALLDDANLVPSADCARGLASLSETANSALRTIITLQDAGTGFPVNAHLLDRAFVVRLSTPCCKEIWQQAAATENGLPVSTEALRNAFRPDVNSIPQDIRLRMIKFQDELRCLNAHISPRAISAVGQYIAAILPLNVFSEAEALDMAIAQRILPTLLATAPVEALVKLPKLLADMPACLELMKQPLAIIS